MTCFSTKIISVNEVLTKIYTWGVIKWRDNKIEHLSNKNVLLVITGNPGIVDFYTEFCDTIHKMSNLPVCLVGMAGHDIGTNYKTLVGNDQLFNVEAQIKHKVELMNIFPHETTFTLIGHSMGAYIIVQLLKNNSLSNRIHKVYLLFPTLEFIGDTPHGKFYRKIFPRFTKLVMILVAFFALLPKLLQKCLIWIYSLITNTPYNMREPIRKMIHPLILDKVFFLASDEMGIIKQRDDQTITKHIDKINVYFGATDGWAPKSYYENLKRDHPEIKGQVCAKNFPHDFVKNNSIEMGEMLSEWITHSQI